MYFYEIMYNTERLLYHINKNKSVVFFSVLNLRITNENYFLFHVSISLYSLLMPETTDKKSLSICLYLETGV